MVSHERDLEASKAEVALKCLKSFVNWYLCPLFILLKFNKGRFLKLPFKNWLRCDSSALDAIVAEWARSGEVPPEPLLSCVSGQYMPPSLREHLLGPSRPDLSTPLIPLERRSGTGGEYRMIYEGNEEYVRNDEFYRRAFRGEIACAIQRFIYRYIAHPHDIVAALHHPVRSSGTPSTCPGNAEGKPHPVSFRIHIQLLDEACEDD